MLDRVEGVEQRSDRSMAINPVEGVFTDTR